MYESVRAKIEDKYGSIYKLSKLLGIGSNDMYCAFKGTKQMFPKYKVLIAAALGEKVEDLFFDANENKKLQTRETQQMLLSKYSHRMKTARDFDLIGKIGLLWDDIQGDMQTCKINGWDQTEYIRMILEMLDSLMEGIKEG